MCLCACCVCVCIRSMHVCVCGFCSCLLKHQLMEGRLDDVTSFNVLWFLPFNSKLHGTLSERWKLLSKHFALGSIS